MQFAQELLVRFGGVAGMLHTGADALNVTRKRVPASMTEMGLL